MRTKSCKVDYLLAKADIAVARLGNVAAARKAEYHGWSVDGAKPAQRASIARQAQIEPRKHHLMSLLST
eukprot:8358965-Lingulodinium_polyedra.AAC.1